MRKEFNITIGRNREDLENWELELFLGVKTEEDGVPWKHYNETTYADIMKDTGIFKSKRDAKMNGWDKDISEGFEDVTVGKLKNRITTYKS